MEPVNLPIVDEEYEYEVWMAAPGAVSHEEDLANSNETFAELQRRTGVNIYFTMANFFTARDQFSLMTSSGDFPAVMNGAANMYTFGPDSAIDEGIFINLLDYVDEYAPHYAAIINSSKSLFNEVSTPEGNLVGFYSFYEYDKFGGRGDKGYLIRKDWMDDLGLETPTTYDELHDVLAAFRDEKGADAALVLPVSAMNDFITGGFCATNGFYVVDGEIKFGPMEQGYREYLELMNQWYEEGLIYKDYYNFANEIMFDGLDMLGAGRTALFFNEVGIMQTYAELSGDPDMVLEAIAPVSKEKGGVIYPTEFRRTCVDNCRWTLTQNCENPEIIIQVADYLYTEEGILLANYGVEGTTFEYNADGKPQFTDMILNPPDGYTYRDAVALHVIDGVGTVFDALRGATGYSDLQLSAFDTWMNANLDYSRILPSDELLNMDEKTEYANIYSDIETYIDEAVSKYIIGQNSFDTYDTDFISMLESMDIQRCIELYQQAYDRYMETH